MNNQLYNVYNKLKQIDSHITASTGGNKDDYNMDQLSTLITGSTSNILTSNSGLIDVETFISDSDIISEKNCYQNIIDTNLKLVKSEDAMYILNSIRSTATVTKSYIGKLFNYVLITYDNIINFNVNNDDSITYQIFDLDLNLTKSNIEESDIISFIKDTGINKNTIIGPNVFNEHVISDGVSDITYYDKFNNKTHMVNRIATSQQTHLITDCAKSKTFKFTKNNKLFNKPQKTNITKISDIQSAYYNKSSDVLYTLNSSGIVTTYILNQNFELEKLGENSGYMGDYVVADDFGNIITHNSTEVFIESNTGNNKITLNHTISTIKVFDNSIILIGCTDGTIYILSYSNNIIDILFDKKISDYGIDRVETMKYCDYIIWSTCKDVIITNLSGHVKYTDKDRMFVSSVPYNHCDNIVLAYNGEYNLLKYNPLDDKFNIHNDVFKFNNYIPFSVNGFSLDGPRFMTDDAVIDISKPNYVIRLNVKWYDLDYTPIHYIPESDLVIYIHNSNEVIMDNIEYLTPVRSVKKPNSVKDNHFTLMTIPGTDTTHKIALSWVDKSKAFNIQDISNIGYPIETIPFPNPAKYESEYKPLFITLFNILIPQSSDSYSRKMYPYLIGYNNKGITKDTNFSYGNFGSSGRIWTSTLYYDAFNDTATGYISGDENSPHLYTINNVSSKPSSSGSSYLSNAPWDILNENIFYKSSIYFIDKNFNVVGPTKENYITKPSPNLANIPLSHPNDKTLIPIYIDRSKKVYNYTISNTKSNLTYLNTYMKCNNSGEYKISHIFGNYQKWILFKSNMYILTAFNCDTLKSKHIYTDMFNTSSVIKDIPKLNNMSINDDTITVYEPTKFNLIRSIINVRDIFNLQNNNIAYITTDNNLYTTSVDDDISISDKINIIPDLDKILDIVYTEKLIVILLSTVVYIFDSNFKHINTVGIKNGKKLMLCGDTTMILGDTTYLLYSNGNIKDVSRSSIKSVKYLFNSNSYTYIDTSDSTTINISDIDTGDIVNIINCSIEIVSYTILDNIVYTLTSNDGESYIDIYDIYTNIKINRINVDLSMSTPDRIEVLSIDRVILSNHNDICIFTDILNSERSQDSMYNIYNNHIGQYDQYYTIKDYIVDNNIISILYSDNNMSIVKLPNF